MCTGGRTGDKVSNDCRNRCGSIVQTESVYVSQATPTATSQALLATKVRSVTVAGIFLSEIFHVFSFTYQLPTSIQTIRLAEHNGSFSVQQTITWSISVELAGWNGRHLQSLE